MGTIDCRQFQERVLGAENLRAELAAGPELMQHAAGCAACAGLLAKLQRLEKEAQAIAIADKAPSAAFLERVEATGFKRRNGGPRVIWIRRSAAAAMVLAAGLLALSLCLQNQRSAEADTVLRDLVSWNLQLTAAHDPAQRQQIYQSHAAEYRDQVAHAALPADEAKFAGDLLQNAGWLITENDRLAEAEHFAAIAESVGGQAGSGGTVNAGLSGLRKDLITGGVEENLQAVHPDQLSVPDRQRFNEIQQEIGHPASAPAGGSGSSTGGAAAPAGGQGSGKAGIAFAAGGSQQLVPFSGTAQLSVAGGPGGSRGGAENGNAGGGAGGSAGGGANLPPIGVGVAGFPRFITPGQPPVSASVGDSRVPPAPAVPTVAPSARTAEMQPSAAPAIALQGLLSAPAPGGVSDNSAGLSGLNAKAASTAGIGGGWNGGMNSNAGGPPDWTHDGSNDGDANGIPGGPENPDGDGTTLAGGNGFGGPMGGFASGWNPGSRGGAFTGDSSFNAGGPPTGFSSGFSSGFGGGNSDGNGDDNTPGTPPGGQRGRSDSAAFNRFTSPFGGGGAAITDPTTFADDRTAGTAPASAGYIAWSPVDSGSFAGGPDGGSSSGQGFNSGMGGHNGNQGSAQGTSSGGNQNGPGTASPSGRSPGTTSGAQPGQSGPSGNSGPGPASALGGSGVGPSGAMIAIAQGDSADADDSGQAASAWTFSGGGSSQAGAGFADAGGGPGSAIAQGGQDHAREQGTVDAGGDTHGDGSGIAAAFGGGDSGNAAGGGGFQRSGGKRTAGTGASSSVASGDTSNPAPEPGAGLILALGAAGVLLRRLRRVTR